MHPLYDAQTPCQQLLLSCGPLQADLHIRPRHHLLSELLALMCFDHQDAWGQEKLDPIHGMYEPDFLGGHTGCVLFHSTRCSMVLMSQSLIHASQSFNAVYCSVGSTISGWPLLSGDEAVNQEGVSIPSISAGSMR